MMDIDQAQLLPQEQEQLMKSESCFKCRKHGHMARQCPERMAAQEAVESPPRNKKKEKQLQSSPKDEPPSYKSLLKQINACSMEERQKLLEVFSMTGSNNEGF
jgi:hypothetical protein